MKRSYKVIITCVVLAVLVACANLTPRKGWNQDYGPVVPHDSIPADCTLCHLSGSWNRIKPNFTYDHEKETGVALRGAHNSTQCLLCHNDRGPVKQFADKGCRGCHEDKHRGKLGAQCAECHNETTWHPMEAISRHNRTRFPLVGAHAAADCTSCHAGAAVGNFEVPSIACESCHAKDIARASGLDHVAQGLTERCDRCHTPVAFKPAGFDHPTSFPLSGGHASVDCNSCHTTPGTFKGLSTDCASCHMQAFQATTNPNHQGAGFSTNCTQCHTTARWQGANFQHTASFPLTNGHAGRNCNECHTTPGSYAGLSTACASCHTDDFQRTTNPNHQNAGFGTNCTQCHSTTQWQGATFQHTAAFPLSNGHANRSCNSCHTTPGVYTGLAGAACSTCHLDDFQRTTNPSHATSGFGTNCLQCHTTSTWQGANFQHTAAFPLTDGHANRSCTACHTTPGVYTGLTGAACSTCHLTTYQNTTNPKHTSPAFSTNCVQCHNTRQWLGANFTHAAAFPLSNGHANRSCNSCHATPGVYTGLTGAACSTCHLDDFQRTTNPNHGTSGFGTNCLQCHNTTIWQGASFQHTAAFPLSNGHANRSCTQCHTTPGVYTGLAGAACSTCHLTDYQHTTNPNHVAANFSTTCNQCHNTTQWRGATFQHTATFPLTNGHAARTCSACHTTPGTYTGLSTACASCHLPDFQHTTNPNHVTAGFGTVCTQCHGTSTWQGATFQHAAAFPLTNGHANRSCTQCHTTPNVYTGLAGASCVTCHIANYQATTNPRHATPAFPLNCTQCHGTSQWTGATFQHTAQFALTNGHANRSCTACHTTPGVYTGLTGAACSTCHLDDFQRTTAPNHTTSGFGTNCLQCHNTTIWQGASFQHTAAFPLTNGHANRSCTLCHTTPGVYTGLAGAACSACHLDDYQRVVAPRHTAPAFPTSCTQCHNTTQWRGASFTHTTNFPLTNGHANRSCESCHHTPGVYTGLTGTCSSCHLADYQRTTNPNHVAAGFPTGCTQCHNTRQWTGATFTHPAAFPLTNGHSNRTCGSCHTTPNIFTGLSGATCATCHLTDYQHVTVPRHTAPAFPTTCTQCHNTSAWTGATFPHTARFALTNGHANRTCTSCHITPGVYTGLTGTCSSCHLDDYQRTTNPNHAAAGLPTNCTLCHNTSQWPGATFTHPAAFQLTNGHANRSCNACHTTPNVYTGLSGATCATCHMTNFQNTTNPKHTTPAFPTTCTQCHNTSAWTGATFPHTARFALTNGHANRACTACHTTPGVYTGLSAATCSTCHLDDFQRTTNPNHVTGGFPTNCLQCHNTTQWPGATFTHPPAFPLTNGHANRACNTCHTTPGVFTGLTGAGCSTCHLDDYQRVTTPRHIAPAFPTTCTPCHNTTQWRGATFPHPASFALTNAHANRACNACHTSPTTYAGLSTDCASCHLAAYQATTNPNHSRLGYPTSCSLCHTPTLWTNATFNHPRINRGNHSSLTCVDCHTVPAATPAFSCTHCHTHRQSSTDSHHRDVRNYQYLSSACYNCHR